MSDTPAAACPRCGASYPRGRLAFCPSCLDAADLGPRRLGDSLELLEPIGRGGMGTVWKARHLRLGREVAVKFLAEDLLDQPEFALRFEREAQALARLSHPGIVAVHDFGREGDRAYIVMEYVAGRPLSALMPMDAARARAVAVQVLDALAYAHARGLVHRDVKPDNILVDGEGRVKVSDFGLARLPGPPDSQATTLGRVLGTPAYMAPEALAGSVPPDPRMDLFSVGVVLHEMLTGRRPAGEVRELPGGLGRVVRRALEPRERRYASAAEMRQDLAAAPLTEPTQRLADEERQWLRAAALLLTLATAAALWAFMLSVTPRVLRPGEEAPLIMLGVERWPDGRVVSRARFETWPTLAAVALIGAALAGRALLHRHWREDGLFEQAPGRAVADSRTVLVLGAASLTLYAARRSLEASGFTVLSPYVPVVGGLIELAAVFFAWCAVLEAGRASRPLRAEVRLWAGLALVLIAPVVELARYLRAWK